MGNQSIYIAIEDVDQHWIYDPIKLLVCPHIPQSMPRHQHALLQYQLTTGVLRKDNSNYVMMPM